MKSALVRFARAFIVTVLVLAWLSLDDVNERWTEPLPAAANLARN